MAAVGAGDLICFNMKNMHERMIVFTFLILRIKDRIRKTGEGEDQNQKFKQEFFHLFLPVPKDT